MSVRFAHRPDQNLSMIFIDRTRRALSNGLPFSQHNSSQPFQNCKKLQKTYGYQEKPVGIPPQTAPKPMNDTQR